VDFKGIFYEEVYWTLWRYDSVRVRISKVMNLRVYVTISSRMVIRNAVPSALMFSNFAFYTLSVFIDCVFLSE
jgi:hypothetical protein